VNSASLSFISKPWNQAPKHTREERGEIYRAKLEKTLALRDIQAIVDMEK
jgi:hypothetical protein